MSDWQDDEARRVRKAVCPQSPGPMPYRPKVVGKLKSAILVAVPGDPLRDLVREDRFGALFDHRESDRYIRSSSFGKGGGPHWCLLYKKHLKGSVGVRFYSHSDLLPKGCFIPTAHEVVAGIMTHYLLTDEWLFKTPVRTATYDNYGNVVCVGAGEDVHGRGIFLFPWWESGHGDIGCAIARKPKGKA